MKFSVTTLVLGLVSAVLGQETLTINTPTAAYYCEPLLITWAGGVGPYNLVYLIGGNTPIPGHEFFATDVPGYSYEWTVSVSYYTPIALVVQDSTGATAESATFTVEYGTEPIYQLVRKRCEQSYHQSQSDCVGRTKCPVVNRISSR
ncbi:hypothetical protein EV401DRAFT_920184 [Pisolithus croceorrhizus]|nr:hypothetical protein EV401DRAFT_920184 [Pisolithus croceorrhizus]